MNQPEVERLVRVEVIMDEMREDLRELIRKVDSRFDNLEVRVKGTEDAIQKAQVSWRVLLTIGTAIVAISGTVGGLIVKFIPFLSNLPK